MQAPSPEETGRWAGTAVPGAVRATRCRCVDIRTTGRGNLRCRDLAVCESLMLGDWRSAMAVKPATRETGFLVKVNDARITLRIDTNGAVTCLVLRRHEKSVLGRRIR